MLLPLDLTMHVPYHRKMASNAVRHSLIVMSLGALLSTAQQATSLPFYGVLATINGLNTSNSINSSNLVQWRGSTYSIGTGGWTITLPATSLTSSSGIGFKTGVSFAGAGAFCVDLANNTGTDSTFNLFIYDTNNKCVTSTITVAAGQSKSAALSFQQFQPASFGLQALPQIFPGVETEPTFVANGFNFASIKEIDAVGANGLPATVTMTNARLLIPNQASQLMVGTVDQYGQSTILNFANKVVQDSDLTSRASTEQSQLASGPLLTGRDQYGGDTSQPQQHATGLWYVKQISGKWWLVDPNGYPTFISAMMLDGTVNNVTPISGHDGWFLNLPSGIDPLTLFYTTGYASSLGNVNAYQFYNANLYRKYGLDWLNTSQQVDLKRVGYWGFNAIAGNVPNYVLRKQNLPYVGYTFVTGNFAAYQTNSASYNAIPDPWDPNFQAAIKPSLAKYLTWFKGDPYCIGVTVDNELCWLGDPNKPNARYQLFYTVMNQDVSNSPAKSYLLRHLQSAFGTPANFNANWGMSIGSWSDLNAPFQLPQSQSAYAQSDMSWFLKLYADMYFGEVHSAVASLAPGMLYFGQKLDYWIPEVIASLSTHADIISFNCYHQAVPANMLADLQTSGKPIFMTEYSFGSASHGMYGSLNDTFMSDDTSLAAAMNQYTNQVAALPNFVGMAWYNLIDDPSSGNMKSDNFSVGFVDITDTPYAPMVAAARQFNPMMNTWHARGY